MSFNPKDYVRITKLGAVNDPRFTSPSWDEYYENKDRCNSLPVDYSSEGLLVNVPIQGESVIIQREIRNGVRMKGTLYTSPVMRIINESEFLMVFETENSRYQIEKVLPQIKSEHGTSGWTAN